MTPLEFTLRFLPRLPRLQKDDFILPNGDGNLSPIPKFLRPCAEAILVAGKSVELVHHMQQHEQLSLAMRSAARKESAKLVESLNQQSLFDQYILKLGDFFGVSHAFQPETPGRLSPQSVFFFSDIERRRDGRAHV